MILHFEPNLQFQLNAINSVIRLFDGQPNGDGDTDFFVPEEGTLNFIDGIAIAGAFLVSPATGITVTLAVALHEIPQEIGDFGLLLSKGLRRSKVLLVNFLSALATVAAAVIFFIIGQNFAMPLDVVLGLAAGFFIYIAVSDIIPDIHANQDRKLASIQSILLVFGVIIVALATKSLHGFIE